MAGLFFRITQIICHLWNNSCPADSIIKFIETAGHPSYSKDGRVSELF
jgi:hypothetical protein